MAKPRVIIVDEDREYIVSLQVLFARNYWENVNMEVITDKNYFNELFLRPQRADILIVSEELYTEELKKHDIKSIFVITAEPYKYKAGDLNNYRFSRQDDAEKVFKEIIRLYKVCTNTEKGPQVVVVTSAGGGTGKTTAAVGICTYLAEKKKVLYIDATRIQSFSHLMADKNPVSSDAVYEKLKKPSEDLYEVIKEEIREEDFSYLPQFKASLMSLGIPYSVFSMIARGAKISGDYDYVIVDAESTFDEEKIKLLDMADQVVIIMEQGIVPVEAANTLISNINIENPEKYIMLCNKLDNGKFNALTVPEVEKKFTVSGYIDKINANGIINAGELIKDDRIKRMFA